MSVVMITGAAGFLGSVITVVLGKTCRVVAVDNRLPSSLLRMETPSVQWFQLDITRKKAFARVFKDVLKTYSRIDFVLHLAFFWNFGTDCRREYLELNDLGTSNVIDLCGAFCCRRVIFASSLSVLSKVAGYQNLDERTKPESNLPYAQSKISSERIIAEASTGIPVTILRIGAVFTEWCELPPFISSH